MVLAIRIEQLVRDGVMAVNAEFVWLGHATQVHASQLLPSLPRLPHETTCLVNRSSLMAVLLHLIWYGFRKCNSRQVNIGRARCPIFKST